MQMKSIMFVLGMLVGSIGPLAVLSIDTARLLITSPLGDQQWLTLFFPLASWLSDVAVFPNMYHAAMALVVSLFNMIAYGGAGWMSGLVLEQAWKTKVAFLWTGLVVIGLFMFLCYVVDVALLALVWIM